jgi:(S)-sulfolactate dehydrogenase
LRAPQAPQNNGKAAKHVNIVISEFMESAAVAKLQVRHRVLYDPQLASDLPRLAEAMADCDALVVGSRTDVSADLLSLSTEISLVGCLGPALGNVDLSACVARNITVVSAAGGNAVSVAEYVIGAILTMRRNVFGLSDEVATGQWPHAAGGAGREAKGARLGLVGYGHTARQTAQIARALGMEVMAFDPAIAADAAIWSLHGARPTDLPLLLSECDFVSLHLPLTDASRGLMGARQIALMKPGAFLINTSQGGIVDEAAVVAALRAGNLAGAAFDVFEQEPLPADSVWKDAPNAMLSPHIAGITQESSARVSEVVASKVLAHFAL